MGSPFEGMLNLVYDQMTAVMGIILTDSSDTLNFRYSGYSYLCNLVCVNDGDTFLPSPNCQVILKPDPGNAQDLFIHSLSALGNMPFFKKELYLYFSWSSQ